MRKFAITVTAATMIVGGLAGCGVDNQAGDMGANQVGQGHTERFGAQGTQGMHGAGAGAHGTGLNQGTQGYGQGGAHGLGRGAGTQGLTHDRAHGVGHGTAGTQGTTGARWTGEGPITDMFTRNDRTGRRTGQGAAGLNQRGGDTIAGGQLGANDRRGGFGTTGNIGHDTRQGAHRLGERHGVGAGHDGFGGRQNMFGAREQGQTGQGMTGQGRGTTGATGNHTGITGDRPGMVDDRGILRDQNREGQRGMTGQQGTQGQRGMTGQQGTQGQRGQAGTTAANYHEDYDGRTVQRIQERVDGIDNIDDSRVVVHDDVVVVAVNSNDDDVRDKVRKTVQDMDEDRTVHVVTDRDAVTRVRDIDDRLRGGAAWDEVGATFTEMLNDLGNAVQRPFERSR
ncbi:YhcN/YlaJ family sporulation lipoprotein [Alkalihalobacterium bogoriense]|uniref:YhcN/YlaJ family sporulation lipoprotein n=1 Tax=Alkalihalobacterium bogoriense TaxID=246272 RepID=UPI00047CAF8B|nr:YhcN/YlaJ family sporulation lipoprotein [Alkalihalobacterium bogoriense]